jgi:hypothetical protein
MRTTDTHVYFWHGEFSNWHKCQFRYKKLNFYNTEQAFMWEKAVCFGDMEAAALIMKTPDPAEAKRIGRTVKNFQDEKWAIVSFSVMAAVNFEKYNQHPYLRSKLFATGNKTLVEASPVDKIWGVGLHWKDDQILDENNWKGMNLLGRALMYVREQLKSKYNDEWEFENELSEYED